MKWKTLAIAATVGQVLTIAFMTAERARAHLAIKRATNVVDLMENCADSCVAILHREDLDDDEKMSGLAEQFSFVQIAIAEKTPGVNPA